MDLFSNLFRERVLAGEKTQKPIDATTICDLSSKDEDIEEVGVDIAQELDDLTEIDPRNGHEEKEGTDTCTSSSISSVSDSHFLHRKKSLGTSRNVSCKEKIDTRRGSETSVFRETATATCQKIQIENSKLVHLCKMLNIDIDSIYLKDPMQDNAILFLPVINRQLSVINRIHKISNEKNEIISKAKRKASRRKKFNKDMEYVSDYCEISSSWKNFIADEFSRRMKEFWTNYRQDTLERFKVESSKCKCCHFYEENRVRKCLQENSIRSKVKTSIDLPAFFCDVTVGHLSGAPKSAKLSIQEKFIKIEFQEKSETIALQSIQEVKVDEYLQICSIRWSSISSEILEMRIENFGAKIEKFLSALEFSMRSRFKLSCENLFSQFSWNFLLRISPRTDPVLYVTPVTITITQHTETMQSEASLMYKMIYDENWMIGIFTLKLNTLFMFETADHELPDKFWILDQNCFMTHDDTSDRPNTLRIIPEDGPTVDISFPSEADMTKWAGHFEAAKKFKANEYSPISDDQGTVRQDCFLGLTPRKCFIFTFDETPKVNIVGHLLSDLRDLKMKQDTRQVVMVGSDLNGEAKN